MEKVKELLVEYKERMEEVLEVTGQLTVDDIEHCYLLTCNSAQSEALSVGNNEQAKEVCSCLTPTTTFEQTDWCVKCAKPIIYEEQTE